jgi:hypothetical protein
MPPDAYDDLASAACALRRARLRLQCLQKSAGCGSSSLDSAAAAAASAERHYVTLRRRVIGC